MSVEVVRRVLRRHINELRFCYERALQARPTLAGQVTIQFVIGPDGAVVSSAVAESAIGHGATETCLATAFRRWPFPSVEGGGVAAVSQPLELIPIEP